MKEFLDDILENTKKSVKVKQFRIKINRQEKILQNSVVEKCYSNDTNSKRTLQKKTCGRTYMTLPYGYFHVLS